MEKYREKIITPLFRMSTSGSNLFNYSSHKTFTKNLFILVLDRFANAKMVRTSYTRKKQLYIFNKAEFFRYKIISFKNLFKLYTHVCDYWMIFNNSVSPSELIAEGYADKELDIKNIRNFEIIKQQAEYDKKR